MRRLLLALALIACRRDDPPTAKADPMDARPVLRTPATIAPAIPPLVTGMMDHADVFGWSADGSVFGVCQTDGGMGARHCQLVPRTGAPERIDDIDPKTHDLDPARTAALHARVDRLALAVRPAEWTFGDLEITWTVVDGEAMAAPRRGVLRVGGRARGRLPAYVIELTGSSEFHSAIHPEAIAVSPDGKMLGVVAHAFGGEFSDEMVVSVIPVERVYDAAIKAPRPTTPS
jgi:hypothetical protein